MRSIRPGLAGLGCIIMWLCCSLAANAQVRSPKAEIKLTFGMYGYDEDAVGAIGGAFAYYPTPRTSGELELLCLFDRENKKFNARGLALTPSFGVDFRHNPVTFQPYGRFAETVDWYSYGKGKGANAHSNLTARFGFRIYVGGRFFIAPEMGMGEHLNMKFTLSAGYVTAYQPVLNMID
jgi:hypothetical protein